MSLTSILPMGGPGIGLFPATARFQVRNVTSGALTAGHVAMLDIEQGDADTVSVEPGHQTAGNPDSVFNCVGAPDAAGIRAGVMVVLEAAIAAGAVGWATLAGIVTAKVDGSGTNATKGCYLIATTGGKLVIAPATGAAQKIVGRLMTTATVSTDTTAAVWFNGLTGFGTHRDN